jgi:hypothetical protein
MASATSVLHDDWVFDEAILLHDLSNEPHDDVRCATNRRADRELDGANRRTQLLRMNGGYAGQG